MVIKPRSALTAILEKPPGWLVPPVILALPTELQTAFGQAVARLGAQTK